MLKAIVALNRFSYRQDFFTFDPLSCTYEYAVIYNF